MKRKTIEAMTETPDRTNRLIRKINAIGHTPELSLKQKIETVLALSLEHLNMDIGVVNHIFGETCQIDYAVSYISAFCPGTIVKIQDTPCIRTYQTDDVIQIHHVQNTEQHPYPAPYNFRHYCGDTPYGTLFFASHEQKDNLQHLKTSQIYFFRFLSTWLNHQLLYATFQDRLVSSENEAENLRRQLELQDQDINHVMSFVSHDFKHPLRSIDGFVELIEMNLEGQMNSDTERYIHEIHEASANMESLTEDLLSFLQIDPLSYDIALISPHEVIQDIKEKMKARLKKQNAELVIQDMPKVYFSARLMEKIIYNLIDNSLKFSDKDSTVIEFSCERSGPEWVFEISDNGPGIPPEMHRKVFKPFEKLDNSDNNKGNGIGLSLCQKIISYCGGRIGLKQLQKQGCHLFFTIPVSAHGYNILSEDENEPASRTGKG